MGLFVYIFVMSVLNLALGYAMAALWGLAPPTLHDAGEAFFKDLPDWKPQQYTLPTSTETPAPMMPVESSRAALSGLLPETALELPPVRPAGATSTPEPTRASTGASSVDPMVLTDMDLNEAFIETSLLKMNLALMRNEARDATIDCRLRGWHDNTDDETVVQCIEELRADCEIYLAEQSQMSAQFHARMSELGHLSPLGDEIEIANLEQAAQIETTLGNVRNMDYQVDLAGTVDRMLDELRHLRAARHRLRDVQEKAFVTIARYENRLDLAPAILHTDPLTLVLSRLGVEVVLAQWWKEDRIKTREFGAALFDLDRFAELADTYGNLTSDRILHEIAQLIRELVGPGDLVSRISGNRFLVVMAEVDSRTATKNADMIRQSIARVAFLREEKELHVTATVGVTAIFPEDTEETLFVRLEESLDRAKESGRNRTFFHNGLEPEVIEAPDVGAMHRDVLL